jgi:transketolase
MTAKALSLRDAFGEVVVKVAAEDERVVVLDADLSKSTRTDKFKASYPDRYLNVGIAEQNMVSIAAGIALGGGVPLVNTFAAFLTRRSADQIAMSVAYPALDVKFFGFHAGVNLGEDGATQQAVEDLGIMQAIPGIEVYTPLDALDLEHALRRLVAKPGPTYMRLSRFPTPERLPEAKAAPPGTGYRVLRTGADGVVVTAGTLAAEVLSACDELHNRAIADLMVLGISVLKPVDPRLLDELGGTHRDIAVVEEHNIHGGVADAISNVLDKAQVWHRLERIGIPDRFGESGPPRALLEHLGLAGRPLQDRLEKWAKHRKGGAQ